MNVAIVTSCFLDRDGVGNTIRDMLSALEAGGHRCRVYHQQESGATAPGHDCRRLELDELLCACADGTALDFLSHDVYFVFFLPYYPLLEVCRFVPGGRLVVVYPGLTPADLHDETDPLGRLVAGAFEHLDLLDYADRIVVHSEFIREELCGLSASAGERCSLLPLCVGPAFAEVPVSARNSSRYGWDEREEYLLYVGRLNGNKRVDVLLKAFAAIAPSRPGLRLRIAGMHSRATSPGLLPSLRGLAASLGVDDRVSFLSDVDDPTLVGLYDRARLFVTASVHEGFCLPVAEAMTRGLPCVVADTAATPSTMGAGGRTFRPDDPADLARVVAGLLDDRNAWHGCAEAALVEARRFSRERFREELLTLVEDVVRMPGRGRARARGALNLVEAASRHAPRYRDGFSLPVIGPVIRWLRRVVTYPVEVSCLRPVARQQSAWNRLALREIERLEKRLEELSACRGDVDRCGGVSDDSRAVCDGDAVRASGDGDVSVRPLSGQSRESSDDET